MSHFCQAPQSPDRLRCYYKTGHSLCTIKRCPIEVVFTNPDIMIFHQIMSNAEIDKVITISKPLVRIVRAIVFYCQSTFVFVVALFSPNDMTVIRTFRKCGSILFWNLKWPWNNKEKRERDEQKTKRSSLLSLEYELVMAIVPFFFSNFKIIFMTQTICVCSLVYLIAHSNCMSHSSSFQNRSGDTLMSNKFLWVKAGKLLRIVKNYCRHTKSARNMKHKN